MSQAAEISVNNGETWSRYRVSKVIKRLQQTEGPWEVAYLLAKPGLLSLFSFALLAKKSRAGQLRRRAKPKIRKKCRVQAN
jgi:hypothetical protein